MIRKIRQKFIRIAVVVLALAMALVALVINGANWVDVQAQLNETLTFISQEGGRNPRGGRGNGGKLLRMRVSEARFFSVQLDDDGVPVISDTSRSAEYSGDELRDIATGALSGGRTSGFHENFLFTVVERDDGRRMAVFLNCETRLNAVRRLAVISTCAWLGGVLLAWALVARYSRMAIRPMIENAVRQKQFITDAGHELKTPLTVISANMDVLTLETGENEWIRSTQKQVAGMRGLVNELIYLSRLDEEDSRLQRTPQDLGKLLREEADPFAGMAEFSGKSLKIEASGRCVVQGDEAALRRLISVLCENAVKYAPEGDAIQLSLRGDPRRVTLTVENGLAQPLPEEALSHLFDRFYRADASRSKEKSGYGLGLSIALAIVEKHGGGLSAKVTDENRLRFTVTLPASASTRQHQDKRMSNK